MKESYIGYFAISFVALLLYTLLHGFGLPITVEMSLKAKGIRFIDFYYSTDRYDFNESFKATHFLDIHHYEKQEIEIPILTIKKINSLRLDIGNLPDTSVFIKSMCFKTLIAKICKNGRELKKLLMPKHVIGSFKVLDNGELEITSNGYDPFLVFSDSISETLQIISPFRRRHILTLLLSILVIGLLLKIKNIKLRSL